MQFQIGKEYKKQIHRHYKALETLRLSFTANVRHFVGYKNKIIDREMYYILDLFKIPKTTYRYTLFNYRNLAVDIK